MRAESESPRFLQEANLNMSHISGFVLRAVFIGVGATIVMDLWALLLRLLGIPSLNLAFLGRWIGHLPDGQWTHESIAKAAPIKGELWIGWIAHYSIGVKGSHTSSFSLNLVKN
jgi:hypothetical protein